MSSRRGVGRTEVLVGVGVLAVIALITVPLWTNTARRSARAEVPLLVGYIRTAEITQKKAFEEYISAEASPRALTAVNGERVPWKPSPGFSRLNWTPPEGYAEVYGAYQVIASEDDFTVVGSSDVDGDGERARVEATATQEAHLVTAENVY